MNEWDEASQYAQDVLDGKYDVCKTVKQSCKIHLDLLDDVRRGLHKGKFRYSERAVRHFIEFTEGTIRHFEGIESLIGTRIKWQPWQKYFFGNIYGWQAYDEDFNIWTWKHKEVYLEVPKKNGKSFMLSGIALYDARMVLPSGAKVYIIACDGGQVKNVFDPCCHFIRDDERLRETFAHVGTHIYYVDDRSSFIQALPKQKENADGKNVLTVIADELHAHTDDGQFYRRMRRGMSARPNRHIIAITTAGFDRFTFCKRHRDGLIPLLSEPQKDTGVFPLIYSVDEEDKESWKDEKVWRKSNPNYGISKTPSHFIDALAQIKRAPSELNEFLAKDLNIWVDNVQAWLSTDRLTSLMVDVDRSKLAGKKCYIGVDLARKRDLSAVAFVFPKQDGIDKPLVRCQFFIDEGTAQKREEKDKVPYGEWIRKGWVLATKGDEINFEEVQDFIETACADFDDLQVNYDSTFAQQMFADMKNKGINTEEFRQNSRAYTDVINAFEIAVESGQVEFERNDCLLWCLANTQIITFTSGRLFPSKSGTETKRIDGAVASLMAFDGMIKRAAENSGVSPSQIAYLRAKGYEVSDDGKILKVPQK